MRRCITSPRSSRVSLPRQRLIRCLRQESQSISRTGHDLPQSPRRPPAPQSPIRKQLIQWGLENGPGANQDQFNFPNDEQRSEEIATITLDHELTHDSLEFGASAEMEDTDTISVLNEGDLIEVLFVSHLD
jgi:hypothetical protein